MRLLPQGRFWNGDIRLRHWVLSCIDHYEQETAHIFLNAEAAHRAFKTQRERVPVTYRRVTLYAIERGRVVANAGDVDR